ncbi:MAG: serine/threonine protein phosphatase [Desulfobacterales bacterium]|nr:serine/threonine protein phosphatase [Desulfobacterales bacterium]MBF0395478.1 serine/threonine protein phosphatase [Desulfobacterales bacterium]
MGNIFAIGDIHGCIDKLSELMGKLDINSEEDTVVFLGDYIDRGPDSFKVVDYLIQFRKKNKNIVFIRGNHEDMLLNYVSKTDKVNFSANGGAQTLISYWKQKASPCAELIPKEHLDFFESSCFYYETDKYIFVHAGLKEGVTLEKQDTSDLIWIREQFITSKYDFGKCVVFGHTPFPKVFVQPGKIGIDTGAVYGNKLTCVKLPDMNFIQA